MPFSRQQMEAMQPKRRWLLRKPVGKSLIKNKKAYNILKKFKGSISNDLLEKMLKRNTDIETRKVNKYSMERKSLFSFFCFE